MLLSWLIRVVAAYQSHMGRIPCTCVYGIRPLLYGLPVSHVKKGSIMFCPVEIVQNQFGAFLLIHFESGTLVLPIPSEDIPLFKELINAKK